MQQNSHPADGRRDTPMTDVVDRNIDALIRRRMEDEKALPRQERVALAITRFAGSMIFVYIHAVIFGLWIVINLGLLPVLPAFDPSLVILAMVASVEAIFISTFVLISQNRMAEQDDKRAELSLQISLLNEHETTRLVTMVAALCQKFEIDTQISPQEIDEMKQNVPPVSVMEKIQRQQSH